MKFLNKLFHLEEKQTSIKTEIIGGLITFLAMCYVLPVVASNLAIGGMDKQGVFVVTALLTTIVTLVMAFVANYPVALSAGMGLNAYIAFTLFNSLASWEQRMILLTVCGLVFFILSLSPIRKWIIKSIPKDIKSILSASLGGFLFFVGLKGSGVIVADPSTLVKLGNFADPSMLVSVLAIFVTIGLMFTKNKTLRTMAIPFGILFAAIAGLTASTIMNLSGAIQENASGQFTYQFGSLEGVVTNLPIGPWFVSGMKFADFAPMKNVLFYGLLRDSYGGSDFVKDIGAVFSNPVSYISIFSIVFINLFDTTASYLSFGEATGITDNEGNITNYRRTIIADATGSLLAGPFGTTTIEPLAESNVGISTGAKTGLAAVVTAFMFLLSAFIYPVFSIFTANSVTAPALAGIGFVIMIGAINQLSLKKADVVITFIVTMMFSILTYSISNGIGFGLITYCVINVMKGKAKEVGIPVFFITGLFVIAFIAEAIVHAI